MFLRAFHILLPLLGLLFACCTGKWSVLIIKMARFDKFAPLIRRYAAPPPSMEHDPLPRRMRRFVWSTPKATEWIFIRYYQQFAIHIHPHSLEAADAISEGPRRRFGVLSWIRNKMFNYTASHIFRTQNRHGRNRLVAHLTKRYFIYHTCPSFFYNTHAYCGPKIRVAGYQTSEIFILFAAYHNSERGCCFATLFWLWWGFLPGRCRVFSFFNGLKIKKRLQIKGDERGRWI